MISLICRCFFLKSSRQSKFASYKRVFHSVLNGKSWTTANVVCGKQKLDSFALSCEAIFKFAKKYKKNSLNDAARTRWQGSRDKNNIRWHHQQKWTQPKPIGVVRWSRALCIMVPNRNCQFYNNYKKSIRKYENNSKIRLIM